MKRSLEVAISRLTERDFDEAVRLYTEGYRNLELYAYTHPDDVRAYLEWMAERDGEGLLKAVSGKGMVGFIGSDSHWFSKREGKQVGAIHELVVTPDLRRRGIGRELIREAVRRFLMRGLDTVELWVGDGNTVARKFYEKLGFKESGRYNYWIRMKADIQKLLQKLEQS